MVLAQIPGPYEYSLGERAIFWAVYCAPLVLAFAFGLMVGSFINVVVYRSPRFRSLLQPPSHCYSCGTCLEPKFNVPVLGWLMLKGRCAYCGAPFSIRYLWIELLTGLTFVAVMFGRFYLPELPMEGLDPPWLAAGTAIPYLAKAYLFVTILIIIAAIDAEFRYIFHTFTFPGMLLGLLSAPIILGNAELTPYLSRWSVGDAYLDAFIGMVLGLIGIGVLNRIWPRGMGAGDVMLAGMLGAFLGWRSLLVALYGSILAGGAAAILVLMSAIMRRTYKPGTLYIPFGPFLAIGALIGMLFGHQWFTDYMRSARGTSGGAPSQPQSPPP